MQTLKRTMYLLAFYLILSSQTFAQEFKIKGSKNGKVKITTISGSLRIDTHDLNEIIISAPDRQQPKSAEGLRLITGTGEDNTGIGLNVQQAGEMIEISGASRKETDYKILIPKSMHLIVQTKGWAFQGLTVSNFQAELEIKVEYGDVALTNVTGPVILNATYGDVKVTFDQVNQSKPMSIIAAYNDVDVILPENTKANLKMQSDYGDIYTDFNLAYDKNNSEDELTKVSKSVVHGTINGGGVEIYLKAPYNNIYLRKKK